MCTVSFGTVSAQDIDIENMDNAQLLTLLQAIMQKLESNESEDVAESLPNDNEISVIGADRFSNVKLFTIYENKKLNIEAIPGYMFYQAPEETPEPEKKEKKDKKDDDSHGWVVTDDPLATGCQHGEQWVCNSHGECHCMIWDGSGF